MRIAGVATVLAAAGLAAASTAHAGAPAKAVGGERALAVSVPADPVPAQAGKLLRTLIRVVNPNDHAVSVLISGRALALGDDGKVSIGAARTRAGPGACASRAARFGSRAGLA